MDIQFSKKAELLPFCPGDLVAGGGRTTLPDGTTVQRQLTGGTGTSAGSSRSDTESTRFSVTPHLAATRSAGTSRQAGVSRSAGGNTGSADQQSQSRGGYDQET